MSNDCKHFHFADLYQDADLCGCTGPHRTCDDTETGDPICLDSPMSAYRCIECGHDLTLVDLAAVARAAKRCELDALKERNTAFALYTAAVAASVPAGEAVQSVTDFAVESTDYRNRRVIDGPMSLHDCMVALHEKADQTYRDGRPVAPVIVHRAVILGPWTAEATAQTGEE